MPCIILPVAVPFSFRCTGGQSSAGNALLRLLKVNFCALHRAYLLRQTISNIPSRFHKNSSCCFLWCDNRQTDRKLILWVWIVKAFCALLLPVAKLSAGWGQDPVPPTHMQGVASGLSSLKGGDTHGQEQPVGSTISLPRSAWAEGQSTTKANFLTTQSYLGG